MYVIRSYYDLSLRAFRGARGRPDFRARPWQNRFRAGALGSGIVDMSMDAHNADVIMVV